MKMEVHPRVVNSVLAKRLWNVLTVTFFMIKKGFISKRKLIMDMNLMIKGGKLLRKSVSNILSLHHPSRNVAARGAYGLQEYEFSCSNSPNPVFFHVSKRKHHYFPCINLPQVIEEEEEEIPEVSDKAIIMVPKTPDYSFNLYVDEFAASPFAVRVSNYSDEENVGEINREVDDEAEEFIRRFYEQLRTQRRMQLLQYQ